MGLEDWLLIIVLVCSILVAIFEPRPGSRWERMFKVLNLFSVRNPKGIMTLSSREYQSLKRAVKDSDRRVGFYGSYSDFGSGYYGYSYREPGVSETGKIEDCDENF